MRIDALLAYAHFLAIFLTGFFLLLEWIRCRVPVTPNRARVFLLAEILLLALLPALAVLMARGTGS
jgi:uncharacterized membrane protein